MVILFWNLFQRQVSMLKIFKPILGSMFKYCLFSSTVARISKIVSYDCQNSQNCIHYYDGQLNDKIEKSCVMCFIIQKEFFRLNNVFLFLPFNVSSQTLLLITSVLILFPLFLNIPHCNCSIFSKDKMLYKLGHKFTVEDLQISSL